MFLSRVPFAPSQTGAVQAPVNFGAGNTCFASVHHGWILDRYHLRSRSVQL